MSQSFRWRTVEAIVMPETADVRHSTTASRCTNRWPIRAPQAQVQEQIYHVLEGEGLMEIAGKNHVVRKHDVIFLPAESSMHLEHGVVDLVFLVDHSPPSDELDIRPSPSFA